MVVADMVRLRIQNEIIPYLEKLKSRLSSETERSYLVVIEDNLREIQKLVTRLPSVDSYHLTEKEIRIADLIRRGKTSKEIAQLMEISRRAVEFHRNRLREKFGLIHQKINLRDFLTKLD
jgi:DNA-binding CsgD family transcriptional regulator